MTTAGANPRSHDNRTRAESFGAQARAYDRIRPTYPDALYDFLTDGPPQRPVTALDVGCGTGIVSRPLTARGLGVLGLEVDERMAAVAQADGIAVEVAAFESWDAGGRTFDLVTCGQAWHWIEPVAGTRQAASVLTGGGRLALMWNFAEPTAAQHEVLQPAYRRWAPDLTGSVLLGSGAAGVAHHVSEVDASGRFEPMQRAEFTWSRDYSRDDWLALLGTHSDHSTLPREVREPLLNAVGAAIDSLGGTLAMPYRSVLLWAQRH